MIRRFLPVSLFPMLIPVGHERGSVRRVPVVTLGIIGVCVVVQLLFQLAEIPTQREIAVLDDAFDRLVVFWEEHPHLAAPEDYDRGVVLLPEDKQRALENLPVATLGAESDQEDLQEKLDELWNEMLLAIPADPREAWAFRPMEPSLIRAVTHLFVHADWSHVLWNMLYLFTCAVLLEDVWGRGVFVGFYLVAGFASSIPEIVLFWDIPVWSIGASGAIAGVMGAFTIRFWNVRMRFLFLVWHIARPVWVSSWLFLVFWFVQNVASISDQLAGGEIGYIAHVAGFIFGVVFALAFQLLRVEEHCLAAIVESKSSRTIVSNPYIDRAIDDADRDRSGIARRRLCDAVRREPDNVDAALALWSVSCEMGLEADAAEAMARAIRAELRTGDADNATDHWRELVDHVPEVTLDAMSLVRISERLVHRGFRAEAAETLRGAFENSARSATGATLLRLATLAEELDPELSASAAREALEHRDSTAQIKLAAADILRRVRGQVLTC